MITIDYKSRVPIYDQITGGIIRLKSLGILKAGDKLPSVRSLAIDLGINPNTVQRAYNILENDGVIFSVAGKGSFISDDSKASDAILAAAKNTFMQAVEEAIRAGLDAETLKALIDTTLKGENIDD